jgi:hypothetical protein
VLENTAPLKRMWERLGFGRFRASGFAGGSMTALTERTVPEELIAVCAACAAGYHEDILFAAASCDCPCHGSQTRCANDKVVA